MRPYVSQFIEVRGINIRYQQIGSGPDILFIHGTPIPLEGWLDSVIEGLSGKYRLTVYDRPGHGQSSTNNINYSIRQSAELALALIDQLNLQRPLVVGHSFGGAIALSMATLYPGNVSGFMTVGPMVYPNNAAPFIFKLALLPVIGKLFIRMVIRLFGKLMVKRALFVMFDPNMDCAPPEYVDTNKALMSPILVETWFREMAMANDGARANVSAFSQITHPITLVHGDSDRIFNFARESLAFHKAFPKTKLIILDNTGHMIHFARPKELVDIIDNLQRAALMD
jgi:pimeloyl-ACP methyl ester carboxylesterase